MSISRSTFLVAVVVASAVTSAAGADDLASAVAGKLSASQAVKGHKVNVRAKAGTVFLEGQVGSAGQIAASGVMPAALRAVISLEADIRPNTLATAKSIVPGTANRIASGSTKGTSLAIWRSPRPCCWPRIRRCRWRRPSNTSVIASAVCMAPRRSSAWRRPRG